MTAFRDDEIDTHVAALPRPAPDARVMAEAHRRARAAFVAAEPPRTASHHPWRRALWSALWNRALEPIIVVAIVVGYLTWAAAAVGALYRPAPPSAFPSPWSAPGGDQPGSRR